MKKVIISVVIIFTSVVVFQFCEFGFENVMEDLTVPAKFTVTYDRNGADAGSAPVDSAEYQEGFTVTVLDNSGNLEKSGFFFIGWNTMPDGSGATYSTGETFQISKADVILYARWSDNPVYRITYDANGATGGSVPSDNTYYETGFNVIIQGNTGGLSRTDYTFIGWNTHSDGSGTNYVQGSVYTMQNSNVTLYAMWSAGLTYRVIYAKNAPASGSVPVDSVNHTAGSTVTVLGNTGNMVYTGYTFSGWNTADDGTGTSYNPDATFQMPAGEVILYAMWTVNQYSVSYNGNGNTAGSAPGTTAYSYGAIVTAASNSGGLVKTGYTFGGWNTQADGNGNNYTAGSGTFIMGASNVTLYARWIVNQYILVYNGNSSTSGDVPDPSINNYGTTVTSAQNSGGLARTSHEFAGWNTQPDGHGTDYIPGQSFVQGAGNVMLYAKWLRLVFIAPGGAGDGSSPASPLGSIAGAIALSQANNWHIVVKASAGTYTEGALTFPSDTASLQLLGGYSTGFADRNITDTGRLNAAYRTVVQGSITNNSNNALVEGIVLQATAGDTGYGITINSPMIIRYNNINDTGLYYARSIALQCSGSIIAYNNIKSGTYNGIAINGAGQHFLLFSNVIIGNGGRTMYLDGGTPLIINNTFDLPNGGEATYDEDYAAPVFVNNLVVSSTGGSSGYAVYEFPDTVVDHLTSMTDFTCNAVASSFTYVYYNTYNSGGTRVIQAITDMNGSIDIPTAASPLVLLSSRGNIKISLVNSVDYNSNYYLLPAAPSSVKTGGHNPSSVIQAYTSGIDYSGDITGAARTVVWSIGAYEQNN